MALVLRDYQQQFIDDLRQAFVDGNRAVLGVLPTGGGKTVVFSYIASQMAMGGRSAHVLVHRQELLKQSYKAMHSTGIRLGLISPKYHADRKAIVQIASVQTLVNRTSIYDAPDLIVIDEAHHAVAGTWKRILEAYPNSLVLGVTATPVRGDGVGLGKNEGGLFDVMIEGPQVRELIDRGHLVQPRLFRPPTKIDLAGVRSLKSGDYDPKELGIRLDKPKITGDAVEHYTRLCAGKPAVVFCVTVAHAQHVAEQFRQAGYRSYAVDGDLDDTTRANILNGLGNGNVQVVTSCDIISEGTDIPVIECAILLRPTQSLGLYLQQVGRALRTADGKTSAIILDHVGNSLIHGLPDDYREWKLNGEQAKVRTKNTDEAKPPTPKQCSKCYLTYIRTLSVCPECGHVEEIKPKQLKQEDGELVEVSASDRQAAIEAEMIADIKMLNKFKKIAKDKGYDSGWVTRTYNKQKAKQAAKLETNEPAPIQLPNYLQEYI